LIYFQVSANQDQTSPPTNPSDSLKIKFASMKYPLFQKICHMLLVGTDLCRDWRGLAGIDCTRNYIQLQKI